MKDYRNPLAITAYPDGGVGFVSTGIMVVNDREFETENGSLDTEEQRQLLAWFAREKPAMVREAMGMDKVIEELEERKKNVSVYGFHYGMSKSEYERHGMEFAYGRAIALLKGEVEK